MTIDDLHTQMTTGFKAVADEFKAVRGETAAEFTAVRGEMAAEFAAVRAEMKTQAEGLDARIKAEGETTRRHFDIVAEQFKEYTRISALETGRS